MHKGLKLDPIIISTLHANQSLTQMRWESDDPQKPWRLMHFTQFLLAHDWMYLDDSTFETLAECTLLSKVCKV